MSYGCFFVCEVVFGFFYFTSENLRKLSVFMFSSFGLFFIPCDAQAAKETILVDAVYSYSNCVFRDNGNQTSTVSTDINFKDAPDLLQFSRVVFIYRYDKNGTPWPVTIDRFAVLMDGVEALAVGINVTYVSYINYVNAIWIQRSAGVKHVQVTVPNEMLNEWPAITLQGGNFGTEYTGRDQNGGVYISSTGSGGCTVIVDPEVPPPIDINITVTAPDWQLGDLEQGESNTTFSRTDEQLCFSYSGGEVLGEKFLISASNSFGVHNSRYRLRHTSDPTQLVPYTLTLDSGGTRIQLPGNSTALSFDTNGRTCFVPTFTTEVEKTVKEGDYSDVLTFTVTTKS